MSKEGTDEISQKLSSFAIAIGAGLAALTMMFPMTMVKTFAKGLASLGKGLWKGVKSVGNMFKTKPVGGKPPNWDKRLNLIKPNKQRLMQKQKVVNPEHQKHPEDQKLVLLQNLLLVC